MKYLTQFRRLLCILILLLFSTVSMADTYSQSAPLDIPANLEKLYEDDALIIQFAPHTKMRLRQGAPTDESSEVSAAEVDALRSLAAGASWQRDHTLSEARLEQLWQRARANSGQSLPDPNNRYRLALPDGADLIRTAQQFSQLAAVEAVYFVPKPPPAASTLDYAEPGNATGNAITDPYQGYLDPAPNGVDARWSWLGMGGRGDGMRICDVEYAYNPTHADLPNVTFLGEPLDSPFGQSDRDHGSAVLGQMGGRNNGVGVKGIAYQAQFYFAAAKTTTGGYDVGAAVLECVDALDAGDVILIEQQFSGPNATGVGQVGLVPVEWFKPWYDDIKTAVAAGIIVVEAAGNGGENLDDADYSTGNNGHYPFLAQNDSGAIIVGSANPPSSGALARARRATSTYGSTVDLQGWGAGIVTAGYGNLFPGGTPNLNEENQWYTFGFGGTSGASPIVAASAAIVQRTWELTHGGTPASPAQIKQILRSTGTPQNGTDNIGPQPNLRAAILNVLGNQALAVSPPTITPASGSYQMPMQVTIGYSSGQSGDNTNIRYTLDGSEPTPDSFIFIPEQGDSLYLNYGVTLKAKVFQFHIATQRVYESDSASATYVSSTPKVSTPVISPAAGAYSQPHQVTISTNTPGATIRYRTDGRAPSFFYPGTEYTGPIALEPGTYEIAARGYKDGYYKSDVATSGEIVVNPLQLPMPTMYPNGGNFNGSVTVYISSNVLGAQIRYTVDGSTPTASSPQFVEPIYLGTTTTLKARVFLDGYTPSDVVEQTFTVTVQANTPTIDPNGGEHTGSVQVALNTTTAGATIRYTTNGAEPTSYSTAYSGPFALGAGQHTVKAKAFLVGASPSQTASADFTVYDPAPTVADPMMAPFNTQYFVEPFTITMHSATEDAVIRYTFTTDGSIAPDPTESGAGGTTYSAPFQVTANGEYRFKVRAFKDGGQSNITQSGTLSLGDALGTSNTPTMSPPGGTYNNPIQVTLVANQPGAIFYTRDGSEPVSVPPAVAPSQQYLSPLALDGSTTLKAKAYRPFFASSETAEESYVFQCAMPELTPGGIYTETALVEMNTTTAAGATIRYTTDGSEPTSASPEYSGPVELGVGEYTMQVRCYKNNYEASGIATEIYVVNGAAVAPQLSAPPTDQSVDAGVDVSFTVSYTGSPPPAIQWQFNGLDIAGETEPMLEVPSAQSAYAGEYRAILSNAGGAITSTVASLSVNGAPVNGLRIDTSSPTPLGNPTYFSANVATGSDVRYSWDFGDGSTAAALSSSASISHTYTMQGSYTVSVTASNEINSQTESVTVQVTEPLPTPTPNPSTTPIPSTTPAPSTTPISTPGPGVSPTPTATSSGNSQTYLPYVSNP